MHRNQIGSRRVRAPGFAAAALLFVAAIAPAPARASAPVHVDQVGYAPDEVKWVAVAAAAASFEVVRVVDGAVVLSGPLTLRRANDPASGDTVYQGDFTALVAIGRYRVHVPGVGDSPEFLVHPAIYDDLYRKLLRGLSYQRCGCAITPELGGVWNHPACHDEGSGIASYDWSTTGGAPGGYRNTIGGWHDAGDYGKYATNNAYAVGILLQAYLLHPDRFAFDDCGIPESGNGVPDLLDEVRWSLTWMLAMQDGDGGVRHRESAATYGGNFLPQDDPVTRYYTSVSSDATAVHAAAVALAARAFAATDPAFAATLAASADAAWSWLGAHPDRVPSGGFVNLYGHQGATYLGANDLGPRLWAAAERFALTGDAAARTAFDARWGNGLDFNGVWYPDSWGDVANLGAFAYRDAPGATASRIDGDWWAIEPSALSSAATWNARVLADGYGCVASASGGTGDYYWGFSGVILRYAWTLVQAERYSGNAAYGRAAREQLHYILGRNPLGKVYLTGLGTRPVLHSHGAWNLAGGFFSVEDTVGNPVPYQLIGGPNRADNADISPWPGRCYEDIADPDFYYFGNWTLNETAINIQAAIIALAGTFSTGGSVSAAPAETPPSPRALVAPNPFRAAARFSFAPVAAPRRLVVTDLAGRLVRAWTLPAGATALTWDGRDDAGRETASGIYLYRMDGPGSGAAGRLVRLR